MSISESAIKGAVPRDKVYRITGDDGLFVDVRPSGKKIFRVRYWFEGRDTLHTLGEWPYLSLDEAKEKAFYLRKQVANGIDPRAVKKYEREAEKRRARTFAEVADGWMVKKRRELNSEKSIALVESRVKMYLLPILGDRVPDEITAADVLHEVLEPIMQAGHIPTAQRILSICGQIFRYGVILGWATRDLMGALPSTKQRHFATITDARDFGALLRAVHGYEGGVIVREALKLQYLAFVRPGELRHAEWSEIDVDAAEWRIPETKMKMKRPHIVPLSRQALEVLDFMRRLTGRFKYVFPSARSYTGTRPMSDAALTAALRAMGYASGEMTVHGFRHAASTFLHESRRWASEVIERQLAHVDKNSVRAVYNRAEYLDERREMMQWWADWCDAQRESAGSNKSRCVMPRHLLL